MSSIAINSFVHTSWVDPQRSSHRQLLHYQYEDRLTETTQPNVYRKFQPENDYGWTSLAYDVSGMAMKPKTARSYPSLLRKIEKEGFQYYRPNLSYTSQSHMKRKLRWMVGLFFDFDAKHLQILGIYQPAQLLQHIESFGFSVYGIIKTTSGYHAYLPMQSLRGCWNGQQTIKRYDLVMKRIARMIGSDINAASAEHYFRTPQPSNVVYFKPVEKPSFEWYEDKVIEKVTKSVTTTVQPSFGRLMSQPAMLKLLAGDFNPAAVADGRKLGRNNAAFTLALGMKADGWSREQATQELHNWYNYRINCEDFPLRELDRVISQAFDKDYKAPSPLFVEAMTGLKLRPISKKIAEEDRKRTPYKQIEEKLIDYLKRYYQEFKKDLMLSQAKLAEALGVSLRSLQSVLKALKDKDQLTIDTKRIGRSNVSIYFLDTELLKNEDDAPESSVIDNKQVPTTTSNPSQTGRVMAALGAAADLRHYAAFHNAISFTYLFANGYVGVWVFRPLSVCWRILRDRYDE